MCSFFVNRDKRKTHRNERWKDKHRATSYDIFYEHLWPRVTRIRRWGALRSVLPENTLNENLIR